MMKVCIVLSAVILSCLAQRSPYAGSHPIGYPEVHHVTVNELADKFGEGDVTTTTMRLPIEALGDVELVKELSKLPEDRQPFWLLNWKAEEDMRNQPQTYPQRGNSFLPGNSNFQK